MIKGQKKMIINRILEQKQEEEDSGEITMTTTNHVF